jgi:hypothetical protein
VIPINPFRVKNIGVIVGFIWANVIPIDPERIGVTEPVIMVPVIPIVPARFWMPKVGDRVPFTPIVPLRGAPKLIVVCPVTDIPGESLSYESDMVGEPVTFIEPLS